MKKTISVTQKHINHANVLIIPEKNHGHRMRDCPIALALNEQAGYGWLVNGWSAMRGGTLLPLPPEARHFVRSFDGGFDVAPFEFEVEL